LQAEAAEAQIPANILQGWLWVRQRNFNATMLLLQLQSESVAQGKPLFNSIYITQDDNAEYGFNIAEATQLKAYVVQQNLTAFVKIYPGADEVGLTMLALTTTGVAASHARRSASDNGEESHSPAVSQTRMPVMAAEPAADGPTLSLVFRKPDNTSIYLIPNYEGQPMIYTLLDQIAAAGAIPWPNNYSYTEFSSAGARRRSLWQGSQAEAIVQTALAHGGK
jgi:hypothetical protein